MRQFPSSRIVITDRLAGNLRRDGWAGQIDKTLSEQSRVGLSRFDNINMDWRKATHAFPDMIVPIWEADVPLIYFRLLSTIQHLQVSWASSRYSGDLVLSLKYGMLEGFPLAWWLGI